MKLLSSIRLLFQWGKEAIECKEQGSKKPQNHCVLSSCFSSSPGPMPYPLWSWKTMVYLNIFLYYYASQGGSCLPVSDGEFIQLNGIYSDRWWMGRIGEKKIPTKLPRGPEGENICTELILRVCLSHPDIVETSLDIHIMSKLMQHFKQISYKLIRSTFEEFHSKILNIHFHKYW